MHLTIRADASIQTGTGHLMRMIALGQAWLKEGGDRVSFISASLPDLLRQRLGQSGFAVIDLREDAGSIADAAFTQTTTKQQGSTHLVVDGYHFDGQYQEALVRQGLKIMVVDDYAHNEHYAADLLLNQNISANAQAYAHQGQVGTMLLGPKYALLREEFRQHRVRSREVPACALLVTLGGSDEPNLSVRAGHAIEALAKDGVKISAKLIVGGANPNRDMLMRTFKGPEVAALSNIRDMASVMQETDIAIAAGGSTAWELSYFGIPALLIAIAENQVPICEGLERAGSAINLGWHEDIQATHIQETLRQTLSAHHQLRTMSENARALVDGQGAQRVVRALLAP